MTASNRYTVHICDQKYPTSFQENEPQSFLWQKALHQAHERKSPVTCWCIGAPGIPLVVRHKGPRYLLAGSGNTGHLHRHDCHYYKERVESSGLRYYAKGVLQDGKSGLAAITDIKFDHSPVSVNTDQKITEKRQHTTLKGLLHLIWSKALLNIWVDGWQRPESRMVWQLNESIKSISIDDAPLESKTVLLMDKSKEPMILIDQARKAQSRLLLMGMLDKLPDTPYPPELLSFADHQSIGKVYFGSRVWERVEANYPSALADWKQGKSVVALALVLPNDQKNYLRCNDIALVSLAHRYIPVENDAERKTVDKLLHDKRSFTKPMRHDAPDEAPLPSFILTDTDSMDTPIVVRTQTSASQRDFDSFIKSVFKLKTTWSWDGKGNPVAFPIAMSKKENT